MNLINNEAFNKIKSTYNKIKNPKNTIKNFLIDSAIKIAVGILFPPVGALALEATAMDMAIEVSGVSTALYEAVDTSMSLVDNVDKVVRVLETTPIDVKFDSPQVDEMIGKTLERPIVKEVVDNPIKPIKEIRGGATPINIDPIDDDGFEQDDEDLARDIKFDNLKKLDQLKENFENSEFGENTLDSAMELQAWEYFEVDNLKYHNTTGGAFHDVQVTSPNGDVIQKLWCFTTEETEQSAAETYAFSEGRIYQVDTSGDPWVLIEREYIVYNDIIDLSMERLLNQEREKEAGLIALERFKAGDV